MQNAREWIGEEDVGLNMSDIGSQGFLHRLATTIANRQGFGDILAEGLLRTGERLGKHAVAQFTERVSGVGFGESYSPRQYLPHAMLHALEPRQPMAMLHEER